MSKEKEARIRDSLLQDLYISILRATLAATAEGADAADAGTAAGVFPTLRTEDCLLLPRHGGSSFRVLRDLPRSGPMRIGRHGVYPLPVLEAQAASYTLGLATGWRDQGNRSVTCVVLPRSAARLAQVPARSSAFPQSWQGAAQYAAKHALPILFVSLDAAPGRTTPDPHAPAPRFPTIPVDAQDSLAVYRVAYECVARAREGGGPSHLLAVRLPDAVPPLGRLEAALRRRGSITKAWQRTMEREQIALLTAGKGD